MNAWNKVLTVALVAEFNRQQAHVRHAEAYEERITRPLWETQISLLPLIPNCNPFMSYGESWPERWAHRYHRWRKF